MANKNDFEILQVDGDQSNVAVGGSGLIPSKNQLPPARESFGVKARLRVRNKGILHHSPCHSRKYKRKEYSPHFLDEEGIGGDKYEDDEEMRKSSVGSRQGDDGFITAPCLPGPSSSSSLSSIPFPKNPIASSDYTGTTTIMKFRARVTTLDEILKAQAEARMAGSDGGDSPDGTRQFVQHEPLLPAPAEQLPRRSILKNKGKLPNIIITTPNSTSLSNPLEGTGGKGILSAFSSRTPSPSPSRNSSSTNQCPTFPSQGLQFSGSAVTSGDGGIGVVDGVNEESSTSSDSAEGKCCKCFERSSDCCHGGRLSQRRVTSGSSASSSRRLYLRDGWGRFFSQLPLWLQSLLGFITKVYWRFVESLLGVGSPYRDENGQGNWIKLSLIP